MSVYYVIGSDSEIKNIDKLNLGFEKTTNLKNYITNCDFNKKFYYVSDPVLFELGFDIKNLNNFYVDENKNRMINFIDFLKTNINNSSIEFYKFWSIFNGAEKTGNDVNYIYQEISYNLKDFRLPDDKFQFDFNTKYIFYLWNIIPTKTPPILLKFRWCFNFSMKLNYFG